MMRAYFTIFYAWLMWIRLKLLNYKNNILNKITHEEHIGSMQLNFSKYSN